MKKWIIEKLGGYPDLDSALDHIKKINDVERKNEILTEAVKKLFNAISSEDILQRDLETHLLKFQGKLMTEEQERQLKSEAETLLGLKLWRVIKMDIRYQLSKKMFEEAKTKEDIVWGQLLTYLDDIIRTRIQSLK